MNTDYQFNADRLDQQILEFLKLSRFFEDFFVKNENFVPEARHFIAVIQDQLTKMRGIGKVALAEDIFHKGAVLVPTMGHVLQGILIMELWGSKANCDGKRQDKESCQKVKDIVYENMAQPLNLFPNASDCLFSPEGSKCSSEWQAARVTLQKKLSQFTALYRDIMRVQMKRYLINHKPVAKEELGSKYDSQVVEKKMTEVVDNIMKNVQRRNSEFMSQLLPMLDKPTTREMKKNIEQDEAKLRQMEMDLQKRIDSTLERLTTQQDQKFQDISAKWKAQEVDFSGYTGDYDEASMEAYKAEYRRENYGTGGPSASEISDMIDNQLDRVWADLDNLYMRVDSIQQVVNERLVSFAEMIDKIEDDLAIEAEQWFQEKNKLKEQLAFMKQQENEANMALTQTMEMMQGENRQRFLQLQQEQKNVENEIAELRKQQELQGGVLDILAEDYLNQSALARTNAQDNLNRDRALAMLMQRQQFLLNEINGEKVRVSQRMEDNEVQIENLRERMTAVENRISAGEIEIVHTQQDVTKVKKSLLRNQAFLWFLTIMGILAYLWYNWEQRTSSMQSVSFFTEIKNAALGPLKRIADERARASGDYSYTA